MGYLYLIFALAFGLIKIYCGKRSSAAATCSYKAIIINTVRMILCVIIGLLFVLIGKSLFSFGDYRPVHSNCPYLRHQYCRFYGVLAFSGTFKRIYDR
jgi:hypothetical protein